MSRFLLTALAASMSVLVPIASLKAVDNTYFKIDAGYSWSHKQRAYCHSASDRTASVPAHGVRESNSFPIGIALGQQIDENWRTEIALDYRHGVRYRLSNDGSEKATGRFNNLTALVNFYYDFPATSDLTPYLGAGIGFSTTKTRDAYWSQAGYAGYREGSRRTYGLAWTAMLGVKQRFNENFSLDLGYRFVHLGVARNNGGYSDGRPGCITQLRHMYAHEVVLGLTFHH